MNRRALGLILILYATLALAYNRATPFGAPPDEKPHAMYVEHLVTKRSLPVLRRDQREAYEAHQPPLYYLLAAPVWLATRGATEETRGFALRLVSTLLGAVGLWLIGRLAHALRPSNDALMLGAVAFAAFLPMRLATAAAVGNDLLAEAVFTGTLLVLATTIRHGISPRRVLQIGLLLGIGLLTKSTCLLLFPVALLGLALTHGTAVRGGGFAAALGAGLWALGEGRRQLQPQAPCAFPAQSPAPRAQSTSVASLLGAVAGAFGVALFVGGWWLVRNQRLYGEVFVAETFVRYFQDTARPDLFVGHGYSFLEYLLLLVVPLTFRSFWGVFGHMQIYMGALTPAKFLPPSWLYPLLVLPTAAAIVGLARVYLREREKMKLPERAGWALLAVTWLLVVAAFLRFNTAFFQAQGRYLFPAMGPIALAFALGLQSPAPVRWRLCVAYGTAIVMLALALYALVGCIVPAFR